MQLEKRKGKDFHQKHLIVVQSYDLYLLGIQTVQPLNVVEKLILILYIYIFNVVEQIGPSVQ